jgi:hypothetical protein
MGFARWPTLLLAAVLDSPALWQAFVTHEMDYTSALMRYLIAVVVAALMLSLLRGLADGYLRSNAAVKAASAAAAAAEPEKPSRRRTDAEAAGDAAS